METNLPTPMTARVYVNLPEAIQRFFGGIPYLGWPYSDFDPGTSSEEPLARSRRRRRLWPPTNFVAKSKPKLRHDK